MRARGCSLWILRMALRAVASARAVTLLRAVNIRPVAIGGPVEAVLDRVARGTIRQAH